MRLKARGWRSGGAGWLDVVLVLYEFLWSMSARACQGTRKSVAERILLVAS